MVRIFYYSGYGCGRDHDDDHHDRDGVLSDHGCVYGRYHDYAYAQNDHVQSVYACDLVYGCAKTFYSIPDYGSN
ncbi:hypothetical protein PYR77_12185 [Acinetobacter soli]|nr:hypothetical protein [Acinetobacter soli]WEH97033.1 hypothetical protein PYR76_11475 [Acinetobacter soli]WEI00035.1 hypothetical protein PYR77_12185 [Acinetobacter soli]